MSINITIPSVGESISEGTIARWLKKEGERVEQGEPLYELETDKATTEVPAPSAGVLHIGVPEGKTVAVGTTIGSLEGGGNGRERKTKQAAAPSPAKDGKKETAKPVNRVQEKAEKKKPEAKPTEEEREAPVMETPDQPE